MGTTQCYSLVGQKGILDGETSFSQNYPQFFSLDKNNVGSFFLVILNFSERALKDHQLITHTHILISKCECV